MTNTTRRGFIGRTGLALSAACLGSPVSGDQSPGFSRIVYRSLGATGLKVSEIGFGVLNTNDATLIEAAIDAGVTFFDTAHSYQNGACEEALSEIMPRRRDEIVLATKVGVSNPDRMREQIAQSLKRLKTDHVDILMAHGPGSRKDILDSSLMDVFGDARKKGMTRFVGFSTHSQEEGLAAAVESRFWQVVAVPYNYFSPDGVAEAISKARAAGIGIVAMKALITVERPRKPFPDIRSNPAGKTTNQQALLRWVLDNPHVDTVIAGMSSFDHLADDIAVMGTKFSAADRRIITRYAGSVDSRYCRGIAGCDGCVGACPRGVAVCDINRCVAYADGYGDIGLARENYNALPAASRIERCGDCGECTVECANGLDLTAKIRRARELFG